MEKFENENDNIIELAKRYLNKEGVEKVEGHLADNKLSVAKSYILGAIDSLWKKMEISDEEATQAYKSLGIDKEEASRIRQDANRF